MNRSLSTLSFRSLLITVVLAAPVCAQNLTTFVNGQPANAVQVNANFEALKTTVQSAQAAAGAAQFTADAAQTAVNGLGTTVTNQGNSLNNLTGTLTVSGGNLGLNEQSPAQKLSINGSVIIGQVIEGCGIAVDSNSSARLGIVKKFGQFPVIVSGSGSPIVFSQSSNANVLAGVGSATFAERMRIAANGNVGIGTDNPTAAKLVVNGGPGGGALPQHGFLLTSGAGSAGTSAFFEPLSISASGCVHAQLFRAISDARIKSIVGRSDGPRDLDTLMGIEITDYTHKDTVTKGDGTHKKVIAQQVEAVYPQAVGRSTDVVPDIYQRAAHSDGWITLATDLKVGERVRLIGENAEGVHEVLEVRDGAFRTGFVPAGEKVFVYGREVNDFRSVDYEAISMLNVSASQELARRVEALTAENTALKNRVASLEAMAAEVAALKAAMQPLLAK